MRSPFVRSLFFGFLFILPLTLQTAVPFPTVAQEPAHYTFAPPPPGTVLQSILFYPAGQAMHSQWRAVVSKKSLTTSGHDSFYQWYLSIYAIDGESTYNLKYRSPGTDNFLSVVKKYDGSTWLPTQSVKIDGAGQLMHPTVENLVVEKYEASADCGGGEVAIFAYDPVNEKITKALTIFNGCALHAKVIHNALGDAVQLTGPYYGPNAPMCCPTKRSVTAIVRYSHRKWTMTPGYFTISASLGAHGQ